VHKAGAGHPGGSLSAIDLIVGLYGTEFRFRKDDPNWEDRDRFIMSKGHASPAVYSMLHNLGILTKEDIDGFRTLGSTCLGHVDMKWTDGVDFSAGSLGMGLSYSAGLSLGYNLSKVDNELFVILGDGECNEGAVWEAAMTISHHKLKNISVILDMNGFQQTGKTKEILNLINLKKKWKSFGWQVLSINGHDFNQIKNAINKKTELPKIIIAKTKKGAGVKEFENNNTWHHNILTKSKYQQIIKKIN